MSRQNGIPKLSVNLLSNMLTGKSFSFNSNNNTRVKEIQPRPRRFIEVNGGITAIYNTVFDGGYIVGGYTELLGSGGKDGWIVKLNS